MGATLTSSAYLARAALTIPEAAAMLHVSRASIYRRIDDGTIRAVKFGALTRIPASEIHRIVGEKSTREEPDAT
jgi:excisionase family DNA binding protein